MAWHTVKQGEWIDQLACRYGFAAGDAIYQHEQNAELRNKRPSPNLLQPGDRVFIPEPESKTVKLQTGKSHRFEVTLPMTTLQMIVHDEEGEPIKSTPFRLFLAGQIHEGMSGGDGLVEVALPAQVVASGELEIGDCVIPVRVGHLDPIEESSGVRARLHNLGYECGPLGADDDEDFTQALRAFQGTMALEETGRIDAATLDKLREAHGC